MFEWNIKRMATEKEARVVTSQGMEKASPLSFHLLGPADMWRRQRTHRGRGLRQLGQLVDWAGQGNRVNTSTAQSITGKLIIVTLQSETLG